MPDASELRNRVYFDKRVTQPADQYGNAESNFVEQFSRMAKVRPRLGGETVVASRLEGRQPVDITVRRDSETTLISSAWRARHGGNGTVYNVRSVVDPYENTADHGKWVEILAEAGGNIA
jgi:SPP1 family predicted phage head-tail adaptor